jgi:hypothetical protein
MRRELRIDADVARLADVRANGLMPSATRNA